MNRNDKNKNDMLLNNILSEFELLCLFVLLVFLRPAGFLALCLALASTCECVSVSLSATV